MGSARDEILGALRRAAPPDPGRPEGAVAPEQWPDRPAKFAEAVALVGGKCVRVPDGATLAAEVAALAKALEARKVVSEAPAVPGNVALGSLDDPHALEGVDLAVLPVRFGVAETGAVWLDGAPLAHRGVFVAAQHVAFVVPVGELVNDMHEAYTRIRFDGPGYGLFIAGPSKTADIEQALVIGAHGPCSCTVFVVG